METAVREQAEGARRVEGEKLTEEFARPVEERKGKPIESAPTFRGTEAAPQREMFGAERPAPEPPSAVEQLKVAGVFRKEKALDEFGDEIVRGKTVVDSMGRTLQVDSVNAQRGELSVHYQGRKQTVPIAEVTVKRRGRPKALEGIGRKPVRYFGESEEAFGARVSRELGFQTYGLRGKRPTLPSVERETQSPELIRRSEIIKEISTKLNVPVRVGRFREKAFGIYKVRPEAIRTKLAQDIPTVAHEIGHHINKILWGSYERKTGERLDWRPPDRPRRRPPPGWPPR
jgi:hypothetical protein